MFVVFLIVFVFLQIRKAVSNLAIDEREKLSIHFDKEATFKKYQDSRKASLALMPITQEAKDNITKEHDSILAGIGSGIELEISRGRSVQIISNNLDKRTDAVGWVFDRTPSFITMTLLKKNLRLVQLIDEFGGDIKLALLELSVAVFPNLFFVQF